MANFRTPNQNQPGSGNPYEGTGFNNLDNFLNAGNLDWGAQQTQKPGTMDLAQGRTEPKAGLEQWMYGASPAPAQNALKEQAALGTKQAGEVNPLIKPAQPTQWSIDNFPYAGPGKLPFEAALWNGDKVAAWNQNEKQNAWDAFQQSDQGKNTVAGNPNTQTPKPGTAKPFSELDTFVGW
jgi:hypothetical protein